MNQKSLRTLFLWFFWAATVIVVYTGLYSDSGFLDFLAADTSRVTWLILGVFALGIVGSFVLSVLVTLETLAAQHIENQVHEEGLKNLDITSSKRAVNRFFIALKASAESNGQLDIEALLHVELASYQRSSHTIEVIGNLLITLGLIGTVMGLTLTLTGLTGSLEALGHNQELLLSGLRQAMGGMGTAFYTTLLGAVLGGVLLRVFCQITEHGIESLHDKVLRTCLLYCSADLRASLERDIRFLDKEISSLGGHINSLKSSFESSSAAMTVFKKEIAELREISYDENKALYENIKMRKHNSELLRHEARQIKAMKGSWLTRVLAALGITKD